MDFFDILCNVFNYGRRSLQLTRIVPFSGETGFLQSENLSYVTSSSSRCMSSETSFLDSSTLSLLSSSSSLLSSESNFDTSCLDSSSSTSSSLSSSSSCNESYESSQPKMYSSACVTSVQHFKILKDPLTPVCRILFKECLVTSFKCKNEFGEQEFEQKMDSCVTSTSTVQHFNYTADMDSSDISKDHILFNKSLVTPLKCKKEFGEQEEQEWENKKRKVTYSY